MSDVSPLSGISGLSFDSSLLSPLLFFNSFVKVSLDTLYDPQRCLDRVSSSFIPFHRRICKGVPIRVSDVIAM